jgi:hypothetical protein
VIGGVFSLSTWRVQVQGNTFADQYCSPCLDPGQSTGPGESRASTVSRFAVEQAEALILAVEILSSMTDLGDESFGFDITDSCGNHLPGSNSCLSKLSPLDKTLATIVGPYYSHISLSLDEPEVLSIYSRLAENKQGIFSLLDVPFPNSLNTPRSSAHAQVVMFQQTCELQAMAAVDFVVHERWERLAVIGSGDPCGVVSLRKFKQELNKKGVACNFEVKYVQQEPIEHTELTNSSSASSFFQSNYVEIGKSSSLLQELRTALAGKDHVIILSSLSFSEKVLEGLSSLSSVYKFLFADFWGDPRKIRSVLNKMSSLATKHTIFALRTAVNGTEKFQEHMSSISFNDSRFQSNRFLQALWESHFSCTIATGQCQRTSAEMHLPKINPILRNYKAPLIVDMAFALREYILKYQDMSQTMPPNYFHPDFFKLGQGDVLEVKGEWTGNRWLFGIPKGTEDWVQPLEWGYDILQLNAREDNRIPTGTLCGTWKISYNPTDTATTVLSLVCFGPSNIPLNPCGLDDETETSCDLKKLYSMSALVFIIVALLVIAGVFWMLRQCGGYNQATGTLKFLGIIIFGLSAIGAIAVSLWIIFGGEALECNSHLDDFLITGINSVAFTVLLICFSVLLVKNRVVKILVKVFGFLILVSGQLAISAVAYLEGNGESGDGNCFSDQSGLASVSYMYSVVLFAICALLLFCNLWSKRGDFYWSNLAFKFISGSLALSLCILYTLIVIFLMWIDDDQNVCSVATAQKFVVIAVFPAILCLVIIVVMSLSESNSSDFKFDNSVQPPSDTSMDIVVESPALQRCATHVYHFDDFPELNFQTNVTVSLDDDVLKEMDGIIIEPQRIQIVSNIGSGNFGQVFKGILDNNKTVAVKSIRDVENKSQVNDFIREGLQMKKFNHANIMELVGICWTKQDDSCAQPAVGLPLIVLPYMELGDLKSYLRKCRPGNRPVGEACTYSTGLISM